MNSHVCCFVQVMTFLTSYCRWKRRLQWFIYQLSSGDLLRQQTIIWLAMIVCIVKWFINNGNNGWHNTTSHLGIWLSNWYLKKRLVFHEKRCLWLHPHGSEGKLWCIRSFMTRKFPNWVKSPMIRAKLILYIIIKLLYELLSLFSLPNQTQEYNFWKSGGFDKEILYFLIHIYLTVIITTQIQILNTKPMMIL